MAMNYKPPDHKNADPDPELVLVNQDVGSGAIRSGIFLVPNFCLIDFFHREP